MVEQTSGVLVDTGSRARTCVGGFVTVAFAFSVAVAYVSKSRA